jgi:hypothetical protein
MKTLLFSIFVSLSVLSAEVPKELLALLPIGQSEITLTGKDGAQECHVRIRDEQWGFNVDAYFPDAQGEINPNDVAHFAIDYAYELYDYWVYSYGVEAVAMYFSPMGSSYDIRSTLQLEYKDNQLFSIEINQEKKGLLGGFSKDHVIYCQLSNL